MYKTGSTAKICLVSCAGFFVCRESMQNRGHNRKKEEYFMNRHVCFYVPQHVLENIARYRALEERGDVSEIRRSIQISEAMRQSRRQSAEESLIPSVPGAHGLQPGARGPTSQQAGAPGPTSLQR